MMMTVQVKDGSSGSVTGGMESYRHHPSCSCEPLRARKGSVTEWGPVNEGYDNGEQSEPESLRPKGDHKLKKNEPLEPSCRGADFISVGHRLPLE